MVNLKAKLYNLKIESDEFLLQSQAFQCMKIGHICVFKPKMTMHIAHSLGARESINCLPRLLLTNIMNNKQTKKSNKFSTSLEMKRDETLLP